MSGICAVVRFDGAPVARSTVEAMCQATDYRQPDGRGLWLDGSVALASQSLHVTRRDLHEPQPVGRDGLRVVADARLDNGPELRGLLSSELTDDAPGPAALILAGYRRWGAGVAERLLGDFAFVVWDAAQGALVAAVDPMGLRTLCYSVQPAGVFVATEVKQVLAASHEEHRVSERAAAAFLLGAARPSRWTFYDRVERLPPGHVLMARPGHHSVRSTWRPDPKAQIRFRNEHEYADAFQELFLDAVRCRMDSPRGVGVFLSGGVDSGSVAAAGGALLSKEAALTPEFRAYSFAFDDLSHCDERAVSRGIVEAYGLPWTHIPADDAWPLRPDLQPPPDRNGPSILWYAGLWHRSLSRAAALGTVVVLGGDRGDLVGGESIYDHTGLFWRGRWATLWNEWRLLARNQGEPVTRVARRALIPPLSRALGETHPARRWLRRVRGRDDRYRLTQAPWLVPEFLADQGAWDTRADMARAARFGGEARSQRFEAIFVPSQMEGFEESERLYAQHGTCFADPFSDRRIAEFVLSIPQRVVNRPDDRKRLIRRAMRGIVPAETAAQQRKVSPAALGERGLRHREVESVRKLLRNSEAGRRGWIDAAECLRAYERFVDGGTLPGDFWATLSLEAWLTHHHS